MFDRKESVLIRRMTAVAFALLLLCLGGALAEQGDEAEVVAAEVQYTVVNGELTGVTGVTEMLEIPASVNGQTITSIGWGAFQNNAVIREVVLPSTLKEIDTYAFQGCTQLTRVVISPGLESIGPGAFQDCTSLAEFEIPNTVTQIGEQAFCQCSALETITVPAGMTEIAANTFAGCTGLKDIYLPYGITSIGENAFAQIGSAIIHADIGWPTAVSLGKAGYGFRPEGSRYNLRYAYDGNIILGLEVVSADADLEVADIPHGVTMIGRRAFYQSAALTEVNMPDNVTVIGESAFSFCNNLTTVTMCGNMQSIADRAFYACRALETVTMPEYLHSIGKEVFGFCDPLTEIRIPSGIQAIGADCFINDHALQTVELPEGLVSIGRHAFSYCGSIGELYLADSFTQVLDEDGTVLPFADLELNVNTVLSVSQNCPYLDEIRQTGYRYRVRETGETNIIEDDADTVEEKVEQVVSALITEDMDDYDKALALHNWLMLNANYVNDGTDLSHQPDGVLLHGQGVCESYAKAYQLLLNRVGIENDLEYGYDHVWNMVKMPDGNWYHIDVTWDDPVNSETEIGGGYERWDYFGLTNYALEGVDQHECERKEHIATEYTYNYLYRTGRLDERISGAITAVQDMLNEGRADFSVTPDSFDNETRGILSRTAFLVARDAEYSYQNFAVPLAMEMDPATFEISVTLAPEEADLVLPAGLKVIEERAFEGIAAGVVEIPDGVTAIGPYAFAGCGNLRRITIPASVTTINPTVFDGVRGLIIVGAEGSAAQALAENIHALFCAVD